MLSVQNAAMLCASCPNLLDSVGCSTDAVIETIDGGRPTTLLTPNNKQPFLPFISNALMKINNPLTGVNVDIIVSSAEAEDADNLGVEMLPRYRQRSQSLDKLLTTEISQTVMKSDNSKMRGFRKETGKDCKDGDFCSYQKVFAVLENPESETRWYFKYFLGKVHKNYLGYDTEKTPFFLSVVSGGDNIHRCILWKKTGNKRMCFQDCPNGKETTAKAILRKFAVCKAERSVKEVSSASLQEDFLTLEEQEGAVNFKFGVLYAHAGQQNDDEMFSNETGSPAFHQFLDLLGDTVNLLGWSSFKGGLDIKNNATGKTSVYTVFEGHEIMFHVSTMLPYSKENRQQVERKRHIGNDIVVIIFVDGDDKEAYSTALNFDPKQITSHFNHIYALVTYCKARDTYRLVMHSAESVPTFGPPLPPNGEFHDHLDFRDFLMAKLINAEKAAYCIPTFSLKRERTLGMLLKDVEQKCCSELRKSLSQISTSPNAGRKYKELEQSFSEVGQKLKVEKITKGEHPTSHRTTAFKRDPWDTTCVAESFPYKVSCGDICSNGEVIVSTPSDGTFIIFQDGSHVLIIDKSLPVSQLVVAHRHKLLLLRTGFNKDSCNYFYAVPLDWFFSGSISIQDKTSLESNKLPITKGCHLFCTSPLSSNYLRVVVAMKSKVVMLVWKYLAEDHNSSGSTSGVPATPRLKSFNTIDGFVKHREFTLTDVPVVMDLMDETPLGKLCVVYQKYSTVEAVDEITGDTQKIYSIDSVKTKIKEMHVVDNNGKNELLLGHNLTCKTISLLDGMVYSNSPEIVWNAEPKNIVYSPPYILAFTADTIEIRVISNGSLIQSIDVPELKLISQKNDLLFTSKGGFRMSSNGPESFSRPSGKATKILGKSEQVDSVHIYKMRCDSMFGRQSSGRSLQSIDLKDEEMSSSTSSSHCSVSDDCQTNLDADPNDSGITMRKLSLNKEGTTMSSTPKPCRHMLVIPDLTNKERIVEVNCRSSSLTFMDNSSGSSSNGNTTAATVVCPSPDSGVHDDFHSPPSTLKSDARTMNHLHSTSSPSILCDSSPSRRSSLPASSILGNKS